MHAENICTPISRKTFLTGIAAAFCGLQLASLSSIAHAENTPADTQVSITLHRGYGAPHGDKSFGQAIVAVDENGVIVAADIDEFSFFNKDDEGVTPVPNCDADFGENFVEGKVLGSKKQNNAYYSKKMIEKGGATQDWLTSIQAIEEFVIGKKPEELADIDTVSGATLADAAGYCAIVAQAAQDDTLIAQGTAVPSAVKIGTALFAAHGTKSFASAAALVADGQIVAANIDEFQVLDPTAKGVVAITNSDGAFGENVIDGKVLASKGQSNIYYSEHMAEKAGATQEWLTSIEGIETAVQQVKVDELEGMSLDVDTVSGSTLIDTAGYVMAIAQAALAA